MWLLNYDLLVLSQFKSDNSSTNETSLTKLDADRRDTYFFFCFMKFQLVGWLVVLGLTAL